MTPDEATSILRDVQANRAKLDSCKAHKFALPDIYKPGMYTQRFTCTKCGGTMTFADIRVYAEGYRAAGGNMIDVMGEVGG